MRLVPSQQLQPPHAPYRCGSQMRRGLVSCLICAAQARAVPHTRAGLWSDASTARASYKRDGGAVLWLGCAAQLFVKALEHVCSAASCLTEALNHAGNRRVCKQMPTPPLQCCSCALTQKLLPCMLCISVPPFSHTHITAGCTQYYGLTWLLMFSVKPPLCVWSHRPCWSVWSSPALASLSRAGRLLPQVGSSSRGHRNGWEARLVTL